MRPKNVLVVVGLERAGTHTMCEVMKKACRGSFPVAHETPPYLCHEAYCKFNHLKPSGDELPTKIRQLRGCLCECNHRLAFFIREIAEAIPNSRFLLLLREPVDVLRSRIMNLSFVDEALKHLPASLAEAMLAEPGHDYNRYRIRPRHAGLTSAYQYYLYDLVETLRFALAQMRALPGRCMAAHVSRLHEAVAPVLNMIDPGFAWDYDAAFRQSMVRSDSAMGDRRAEFHKAASDVVEPHRQEIETSFLLACTGLAMSEAHLPELLASPHQMMKLH